MRRGVEATSLVTNRDEVLIEEGDSDAEGVEIDLDMTPAKRAGTQSPNRSNASPPHSAIKLQRNAAGDLVSPRGGRPWLKTTQSVGSKARGKASEAPPRKERHFAMIEADEERLERALTKNAGIAAGERMYYLAMKRRQRSVSQQQAETDKSPKVDKECTFHPALSSGTVRLIDDTGGYRPPCERFDAQELRLAKSRLIQQHANMQTLSSDCTFTPAVDSVSQALVKRSRSASRSRGEERAGPRLFDEGMKRLQHQKFMATQIKLMEDEERVGGLLRLGKGDADAVSRRLHQWQVKKDHDIELLRHEEVLSWRPQRSRSCDDQAFFTRLHAPPTESPRPARAASPSKVAPGSKKRGGHQDAHTVASPDKEIRVSERSRQLAGELQKIRFRALFAKYVPSASPDGTVTVELVRDQVKKLFPHDAGIADALSHFKLGEQISRNAFVAALCAYERRFGPQRWGRMEHHRLQEEDSDDDVRPRRVTGRPQISTHTQELVAHRGRNGKPIFDQLLERGKESEKRKQQRQQEVLQEQAKELTFWPSISGGRSVAGTSQRAHGPTKQRSASAPRTPTTPVAASNAIRSGVASLNVSVEHHSDSGARSTPYRAFGSADTRRHAPRDWRDNASKCDEVDDLLRSIDEQLLTGGAPPAGLTTAPSRCDAPISPFRGEEAFSRLDLSVHESQLHRQATGARRSSPSRLPTSPSVTTHGKMDSLLNTRTPLRKVDWNQSLGGRNTAHNISGSSLRTPPSTSKRSPPPPPKIASFAADADDLLDLIYCDVSIEKRYTHVQQHWSPLKQQRGGRTTATTVTKRHTQLLKENRAIVVEGRSRKAFR